MSKLSNLILDLLDLTSLISLHYRSKYRLFTRRVPGHVPLLISLILFARTYTPDGAFTLYYNTQNPRA